MLVIDSVVLSHLFVMFSVCHLVGKLLTYLPVLLCHLADTLLMQVTTNQHLADMFLT